MIALSCILNSAEVWASWTCWRMVINSHTRYIHEAANITTLFGPQIYQVLFLALSERIAINQIQVLVFAKLLNEALNNFFCLQTLLEGVLCVFPICLIVSVHLS